MNNNHKITILKNLKKAMNQAYANISFESDCSITKGERKEIEKEIFYNDRYKRLTKNYIERRYNNGNQ